MNLIDFTTFVTKVETISDIDILITEFENKLPKVLPHGIITVKESNDILIGVLKEISNQLREGV
tara:strand:+ start:371 stop:562 length:192 start_codon:yes stop_codon:yes gene_type:complete